MIRYQIYQTSADYVFASWDEAKENFTLKDYKKVWSGEEPSDKPNEILLEELWEKFNIDHPVGYQGRSVSMSDVIELIRNDFSYFYYCDTFGWEQIEFIK